jgi:hypothetical protein
MSPWDRRGGLSFLCRRGGVGYRYLRSRALPGLSGECLLPVENLPHRLPDPLVMSNNTQLFVKHNDHEVSENIDNLLIEKGFVGVSKILGQL